MIIKVLIYENSFLYKINKNTIKKISSIILEKIIISLTLISLICNSITTYGSNIYEGYTGGSYDTFIAKPISGIYRYWVYKYSKTGKIINTNRLISIAISHTKGRQGKTLVCSKDCAYSYNTTQIWNTKIKADYGISDTISACAEADYGVSTGWSISQRVCDSISITIPKNAKTGEALTKFINIKELEIKDNYIIYEKEELDLIKEENICLQEVELEVEGKGIIEKINEKAIKGIKEGQEVVKIKSGKNILATGIIVLGTEKKKEEVEEKQVEIKVEGIEVAEKEITIKVGNQYQIVSKLTPSNATNQDIEYLSEDSKIVEIEKDGIIKAVGIGETRVKVITKDGNYTEIVKVKVKEKIVNVEGIEIEEGNITIKVGDSKKINATIIPSNANNKSVKYESSNEEIATINEDGIIRGIKEGQVRISAITYDGEKKATIEVKIERVIVRVMLQIKQ